MTFITTIPIHVYVSDLSNIISKSTFFNSYIYIMYKTPRTWRLQWKTRYLRLEVLEQNIIFVLTNNNVTSSWICHRNGLKDEASDRDSRNTDRISSVFWFIKISQFDQMIKLPIRFISIYDDDDLSINCYLVRRWPGKSVNHWDLQSWLLPCIHRNSSRKMMTWIDRLVTSKLNRCRVHSWGY